MRTDLNSLAPSTTRPLGLVHLGFVGRLRHAVMSGLQPPVEVADGSRTYANVRSDDAAAARCAGQLHPSIRTYCSLPPRVSCQRGPLLISPLQPERSRSGRRFPPSVLLPCCANRGAGNIRDPGSSVPGHDATLSVTGAPGQPQVRFTRVCVLCFPRELTCRFGPAATVDTPPPPCPCM